MQSRRAFGKLVLGGLATTAAARAIDWPQWRGPNQDGVSPETGLLQDWPASGPRLVWDVTGVGNGYSAVSTAGDRIVTSGEVNGQSSVICLSAKDGKEVWAEPIGKTGTAGCCNAGGPRTTPTINGNVVFAISQFGEVAALNLKDGKEVWKKDLIRDFGGQRPEWGFSSAPVVDGNNVILTAGSAQGTVVALDKKTGNKVWQSSELTDGAHYSSLVVATIDGVKQYIQLTDKSLVGINPADGKLLWRADRKGATAVIPTPVVFGNLVYTTSGYAIGCNCFEVKKNGNKFEATELWNNKQMVNHHGGVIRVGPNVYGHSDSKGWTCQDIKTGNVLWQDKSFGKGSIAYADNRFVLRTEDRGTLALIEASPAGYKEHGKFEQPNRSKEKAWAHPVISNGKLYIRDEDHLLCYDLSAKS
ncbi:MAG TPA: PQQ-binding-like beta-propeller repeat protein [Verrucomicrobiae bacterium]|nr:PQQ-binding-like beta-propeller repeat protein [Verrucomicrobiae bacterium]